MYEWKLAFKAASSAPLTLCLLQDLFVRKTSDYAVFNSFCGVFYIEDASPGCCDQYHLNIM